MKKKINKADLKKLAMMGITGGILFTQGTATASIEEDKVSSNYYAAAGCGGHGCSSASAYQGGHGCGAASYQRSGNGSYNDQQTADSASYNNYQNYQRNNPYYSDANQQDQQGGQQGQQNSSSQPPMPKQMMPNYQPRDSEEDNKDYNYNAYNRNRSYSAQNDSQNDSQSDLSDTSSQSITQEQLLNRLNDPAKATYNSLNPEGKALALKLANQSCKGKNDCKGLNSCRSAKNSCAGQGACAGQSPGPFKDKNTAVKVAAKKMSEKRAMLNQ